MLITPGDSLGFLGKILVFTFVVNTFQIWRNFFTFDKRFYENLT